MNIKPGQVDPRVLELLEKHGEQLQLSAKELAEGTAKTISDGLSAVGEPPLSNRESFIIGAVVGLISQVAFQTTITAVLSVGDAFDEGLEELKEKTGG